MLAKAFEIARLAHANQKRKFSGLPYIVHPIAVALDAERFGLSEHAVAAAFLHDVIEDCGEDWAHNIQAGCGDIVLGMVRDLTNPSERPEHKSKVRRIRKQIDLDHLSQCSQQVKCLKMLDRADNMKGLVGGEVGFVKLYVRESYDLLETIKDADPIIAAYLLTNIIHAENQVA